MSSIPFIADNTVSAGWGRFSFTQLAVTVFLVAVLVFSGTLGHDLVWDDEHIIRYARELAEDSGPAALLTAPFTTRTDYSADNTGYYRPVSFLSMWINDPVGEPSPLLFHLVNVVLHGINTILVFVLLRLLLPAGLGPFFGTLLFAVHPVHAESVAFVSGRTDLLAAFFTLATVILWIQSRREPGRWFLYFAGMVSFALACLSKEAAFVLPAVVAAWILVPVISSREKNRPTMVRDLQWIAGWFGVLGTVILIRIFILGISFGPGSSSMAFGKDIGLTPKILEVLVNISTYLRLMVFPWPLEVYYPPVSFELTLLAGLASVGFAALCFILRGERHHHVGSLAIIWVVVFLVPVSGVVGLGLSVIAERFCYLPSVGIVLVAGYALELLRQKVTIRKVHTVALSVLLLLLTLGAIVHSSRWRSEVVLFEHAARSALGTVPNIYFNLGNALVAAERHREGIGAFEEAIRLNPSYIDAMLNLSTTHMELAEHERALEILYKARDISSTDQRLWINTGMALVFLGHNEDALDAYGRAIELGSTDPAPSLNSGNLLFRLDRYEEGVEAYRRVLFMVPGHFDALMGLGRSLERLERWPEAGETYLNALEDHPEQVSPYLGLGRALLVQGKSMEAGAVYRAAVKVAPAEPLAHRGIVLSAYQEGFRDGAVAHIAKLRQTQPALAREMDELLNKLVEQQVEKLDNEKQ